MEAAPRHVRLLFPLGIAILALQGWTLYRLESRTTEASGPKTPASAAAALSETTDRSDALAATLTRIDARLAALEFDAVRREDGMAANASPTRTAAEIPVGSPAALAADRSLARLLPGGSLTQEELQQVYIGIGLQPADQRGALMAALSRAINDGRVRIRP